MAPEPGRPGPGAAGRGSRGGKFAAVALSLALWQLAAAALHSPLLLVGPLQVARRLLQLAAGWDFWARVAFSAARILAGFLLALAAGSALAAAASRWPLLQTLLWPPLTFVKSAPVASFIVLCLLWLRAGSLPVFIAFLMALPLIYSNLLEGIRQADRRLLQMARLFGVGPLRRLRGIYLPALRPYLATACSLALGLSWKAGIAAEVIGIPAGSVGEMLYQAKLYLSSADLLAWTFAVMAASALFEQLFAALLRAFYRRCFA